MHLTIQVHHTYEAYIFSDIDGTKMLYFMKACNFLFLKEGMKQETLRNL